MQHGQGEYGAAPKRRGEWEATYFATPGYENSAAGYDAYQAALTADTPVIISEAVTANFSTLKQKNLGYCDWAEIKNISNESVRLSGIIFPTMRRRWIYGPSRM